MLYSAVLIIVQFSPQLLVLKKRLRFTKQEGTHSEADVYECEVETGECEELLVSDREIVHVDIVVIAKFLLRKNSKVNWILHQLLLTQRTV